MEMDANSAHKLYEYWFFFCKSANQKKVHFQWEFYDALSPCVCVKQEEFHFSIVEYNIMHKVLNLACSVVLTTVLYFL